MKPGSRSTLTPTSVAAGADGGLVCDVARSMSIAERVLWLAGGGLAMILAVVMAEAVR
jgi:hypothetical protein